MSFPAPLPQPFRLAHWAGAAVTKHLWSTDQSSFGDLRLPNCDLGSFVKDRRRDMDRLRAQLPKEARAYVHLPYECWHPEFQFCDHAGCVWSVHHSMWRKNEDPLELAASTGDINLFEYVRQNYLYTSDRCVFRAARNGHGAMVRHILSLGWNMQLTSYYCTESLLAFAERGDTETVHSMLEYGVPMSGRLMTAAAGSGSMPLLSYLRDRGCPVAAYAIAKAAGNGHLAMVQHLLEHGYPVSWEAIVGAAENGHFAVVQYLHESGAPNSPGTLARAVRSRHTQIVKYGVMHKFPDHNSALVAYYLARAADA